MGKFEEPNRVIIVIADGSVQDIYTTIPLSIDIDIEMQDDAFDFDGAGRESLYEVVEMKAHLVRVIRKKEKIVGGLPC